MKEIVDVLGSILVVVRYVSIITVIVVFLLKLALLFVL